MRKLRTKPVYLLTIVEICLLASAFLPIYFKSFFVNNTGHLTVMPPQLAIVLAFALAYKQEWARKTMILLAAIAVVVLCIILLLSGFRDVQSAGLLFLLFLQIVSLAILSDHSVKHFLKHKKQPANDNDAFASFSK
jgi:hypothetical protein